VSSAAARYDMGPAQRDFGYVPKVSINEGLTRLKAALTKSGAVTG
jgi:2-alkyl-3-oxoalkanoate reductase